MPVAHVAFHLGEGVKVIPVDKEMLQRCSEDNADEEEGNLEELLVEASSDKDLCGIALLP